MQKLISTRGAAGAASAPEAILQGIAPDGGLYTPDEIPFVPPEKLVNEDYQGLSRQILRVFLPGYTENEIDDCVNTAYRNTFDAKEICPLKKVGGDYVLELFHGPTAAFKDIALSVLPRLMACAMKKEKRQDEILILTATSGDTGSAALTGFRDVPGIRILTFYPERGISPIQKRQMTAAAGKNVYVCAVSSNFDAAQAGVKRIFSEIPAAFCRENHLSLSSANSINFGRLAPQIVYYYSAYLTLVRQGEIRMGDPLDFSVPTGNFGDILAGYLAKKAGLPIRRLICASNANRVLTDFLQTGVYNKNRPFYVTASPSMDILVSSNLERLLFLESGCDGNAIQEYMESLKQKGVFTLPSPILSRIQRHFSAECADDAQALNAIGEVFDTYHYVMDPHTAVAWQALQKSRETAGEHTPCVVLSTASPYKFPHTVLGALGAEIPETASEQMALLKKISGAPIPSALENIFEKEERFRDVIAPQDMMDYVMRKAENR